ncbi:DUF192 domain-containing protein [Candidatus Saccharibacteria bacterium]|nr:DUF192 domain-containing protein [Candidatus Saccharibacteria bacterium]
MALLVLAIAGLAIATTQDAKPKPKITNSSTLACGPYKNDKTIVINGSAIKAEVVSNKADLQKGLGGRPCILPNQGMLFEFDKPGIISIWMKDMKFPIDVIWINTDHKVAAAEIDLKPSTYPDKFINRDHPAQYVLELKANRAKELGLNIGSAINF